MSTGEDEGLQTLWSAIDSFLERSRCAGSPAESGSSYWLARPVMTTAELRALASLKAAPWCAETLACRLDRDLAGTLQFLQALEAVGIVERDRDQYVLALAVTRYLEAYLGDGGA